MLVVAVVVKGLGGGGLAGPPPALIVDGAGPGDPFAYRSSHEADFVARATAGNAQVLFSKSPGGALATAARVAAFRPAIDRAAAGTGIDPNLLEGLVFVESAGRPEAIAGTDPADAAGLTQILAATGQSMLGMHIDLAASRRLTSRSTPSADGARRPAGAAAGAARAAVDDRFNPPRSSPPPCATWRSPGSSSGARTWRSSPTTWESATCTRYSTDYDGGRPVPYAQLYFDSAPDRHAAAFGLMAGFSDDSLDLLLAGARRRGDHAPVSHRPCRARAARGAADRR